jgi:hypothetical protein
MVPHSKPVPTHRITFYWQAKHTDGEREIIGTITLRMDDNAELRRLQRLQAWLHLKIGKGIGHTTLPLEVMKQANRLSDLERMRRKWNKVMRAWSEDRDSILKGSTGMFVSERLAELDALLEQAKQKVERTYGHRIEDLHDQELAEQARKLDAQGLIERTDYYHLS